MATSFRLTPLNTADTAVASTSLNALASGSYALGAAIDNSTDLYPLGDLEVVLSSSVTAGGTGTNPTLSVYLLPSMDGGTTYPSPPGGTAGVTSPSYLVGTYAAVPGAAVTTLHIRGIPLTAKFKILLLNSLGVAMPSTNTSTCKVYRYGFQAV